MEILSSFKDEYIHKAYIFMPYIKFHFAQAAKIPSLIGISIKLFIFIMHLSGTS